MSVPQMEEFYEGFRDGKALQEPVYPLHDNYMNGYTKGQEFVRTEAIHNMGASLDRLDNHFLNISLTLSTIQTGLINRY